MTQPETHPHPAMDNDQSSKFLSTPATTLRLSSNKNVSPYSQNRQNKLSHLLYRECQFSQSSIHWNAVKNITFKQLNSG